MPKRPSQHTLGNGHALGGENSGQKNRKGKKGKITAQFALNLAH
jgi:hypothetical protein